MINTVINEPLIKSNVDCFNVVVSHMAVRMEKKSKASKILCVGGNRFASVSEVYNVLGKLLKTYSDLPHVLSYHCVLEIDDFIYCIGGVFNGEFRLKSDKVYRLNLKNTPLHWEQIASMSEQRFDFVACVNNGSLIAAGGYIGAGRRSNSVETYEPRLNKRRNIASLNVPRDEFALVAANNKLSAIGGSGTWYSYTPLFHRLNNWTIWMENGGKSHR